EDPYVTVSEAPAWEALERLAATPERLGHYRFREACGLPPLPHGPKLVAWLAANGPGAAPVLAQDLHSPPSLVLDPGVSSLLLGADPRASELEALTATISHALAEAGVDVAVGRYDEARPLYTSELFGSTGGERSAIHSRAASGGS